MPAQVPAQVTAVKAGRLIDTEAGTVLTNQVILIRNGQVESVGPAATIPADATVIDLSAITVMPGLIDCHTHLADEENAEPLSGLERTAAEARSESIPNAAKVLMAGFTTVRDLGTYRALTNVALRDAINRGTVVGPRMLVVGGVRDDHRRRRRHDRILPMSVCRGI